MNDNFTNNMNSDDENIARKLSEVAEKTHVNAHFASELEERLRNTHPPKMSWPASIFGKISPTLRWVALMILLALVLSWSIKSLIPVPQPATDNTPVVTHTSAPTPGGTSINDPTPTPGTDNSNGYDWRGAKLYLVEPLPQSPEKAHVYLLNKDEPSTTDQVWALADRFGIQGELYSIPGFVYGTTDYMVSNGKQSLQVHSDQYFNYIADMAKNNRAFPQPLNENAETIIHEFLLAHGFDFPFRVFASDSAGGYAVEPLAPDSIPMGYESFSQPVMRVVLDENGQVLTINAVLMDYGSNPVGEYGIITAEEAFQRLLDDSNQAGKTEFFHSAIKYPQEWYREYPDNETVTIYGTVSSNTAVAPNQPPLILIDGVRAIGNTTGMEALDAFAFVEAKGQYLVENGIRKFQVDSWATNIELVYISGTLRHDGDQIVLTASEAGTDQQAPLVGPGKQYPLIDPPADLPLDNKPDSQLNVQAVLVDRKLFWTYIQLLEIASGGGGGGGGAGFYKLNLSGKPVPFPTATPQPNVNQGSVDYVIKDGDTLYAVAEAYGTTPEKIIEANSWLNGGVLMTGKTLIIPNAQQSGNNPLIREYTVKDGDTCGVIATNFGVSIRSLIDLNQLSAECFISVGQSIKIPQPVATLLPLSPEVTKESVPQNAQDLRGFLSIAVHKKADGSKSKEYSLWVNKDNMIYSYQLNGLRLAELDAYNGLPILVSGIINDDILVVDSYNVPYPNLKFQIAKGTQRLEELSGQTVVIFTTEDGRSFVEFMGFTEQPTNSFIGNQGDRIQQEILIIPDETFAGMPVARIFQSSVVEERAPDLQVQANQIISIDDSANPEGPIEFTPPNLTIDKVELTYFVSNPYYQMNDPNYNQRSPYIQPVWHFHGRYADGSEFDVVVQALKQEFLLPELAPGLSPG